MARFGAASGLAGGAVLAAFAIGVLVLAPSNAAWSRPAGLGALGLAVALVAVQLWRLRRRAGGLTWSTVLDAVLLLATVMAVLPAAAVVRGFVELFAHTHVHSTREAIAYGLAFAGLLLGGLFFAYAVKYYLSTVLILLTALLPTGYRHRAARDRVGNERQHPSGLSGISRSSNGNGNGYHVDLGYKPFVSVHVAAYNEKRVIERLLTSLDQLDYPAYEVVVVDDSNDESVQILQRWTDRPKFKILHRTSRAGFKGGALNEALKLMDPRTEYVVVFDADSMPFPDSIDRFLPYFYEFGEGRPTRREGVAAVQSYQWHVLNKSESWLTEAVRAEYAGSYMVERPFQDAIGSLKMVAGTAYMIRADLLRGVGWGTSITEDWELTLKLYARGYKIAYTPWAETPAECVATFPRLARQRMRWAEGHTHNVRKYFWPIMLSPFVAPLEKLEFAYLTTYYLQAALFVVGSVSWLLAELVFNTHVPGWTAVLGWSLLFSNIFALPLMNLGGLILEEAPGRDLQGVLGALVLSFALVPFQGWAALKGLIRKDEGPWFRTPKTGHITDEVHHLRRLRMLRRWLLGAREGRLRRPSSPAYSVEAPRPRSRRLGWIVAGGLGLALLALAWGSTRAPVSFAAGNPLYLHGSGTAPGCAPSTLSAAPGARAPVCQIGDTVGTWTFSGLPAQTVAAGVWSFTAYWVAVGPDHTSNISVSVGVAAGASCAGFVALIPNLGTTWSTTFGSTGANKTSPFTMSTSGSQAALVIPPGGSLCLRVDLSVEQDDELIIYDGPVGTADTRLIPPTTVVPEALLPFAGLALVVPLITGRRRLFGVVARLWR
jgi:cellulose synthase/poly-beta-1,6-N-acetylglucosamine synthase-like glycosyltransferase